MSVELIPQILMIATLLMAFYVAFSQNLLWASVVFFAMNLAGGGLLLGMGADYLAVALFVVGILGTAMILLFSSVTLNRSNSRGFREEFARRKYLLVGCGFVGTVWITILGWALLNNPFFRDVPGESKLVTISSLGNQMFQNHTVVTEIIAALFLLLTVGAGFLLRNAEDK